MGAVERSWTVDDFEGLGSDLLLTQNVLSLLITTSFQHSTVSFPADLSGSAAGSTSIKMIHTYCVVLCLSFC